MKIDLKNLAIKNQVRIDDHEGYKSNPQYFYNSLRNAFNFYFKTFITNNASYEIYISATSTDKKARLKILENDFLDEENTVLSLVSFQRFFELFIKDLLKKTNPKLIQSEERKSDLYSPSRTTWDLIDKIQSKTTPFRPYIPNNSKGVHLIPFNLTLKRFYDLIKYTKDSSKNSNVLIKKFADLIKKFSFLDNGEYEDTLIFINWYRDAILHNGSKLPTLRFLDYIITQRIVPIANKILVAENEIPQEWLYFTKTVTGINILDELMNVKFGLRNRKNSKAIEETFNALLLIGHLKELGRANMNMDNFVKNNNATYEYNYKDPIGRGERFATIEKEKYSNAVEIKICPCCGGKSLVLYRIHADDLPIPLGKNIEWIKCYTCDYHLRYNVFDLHYFNARFEKHFEY